MSKFKSKAALEAEVEALSPARRRLYALIDQRTAINAAIDSLNTVESRLSDAQATAAPIAAELGALDSSETSAFESWARSGKGDAPKPDAAKRHDLVSRLAEATAQKEAAERAKANIAAERHRESLKLGALAQAIDIASAAVLIEEAEPLIDESRAASYALSVQVSRIQSARNLVLSLAHAAPAGEPAKQLFEMLTALNIRLDASLPRVEPEGEIRAHHAAEWNELLTNLHGDAAAKLEG